MRSLQTTHRQSHVISKIVTDWSDMNYASLKYMLILELNSQSWYIDYLRNHLQDRALVLKIHICLYCYLTCQKVIRLLPFCRNIAGNNTVHDILVCVLTYYQNCILYQHYSNTFYHELTFNTTIQNEREAGFITFRVETLNMCSV